MISVVIPMYNSKNTIVECINSVLNQTRIDLIDEIIVVDDGSTDTSCEEIEKNITDNLVHVIHQDNRGVSSARNKGIRYSKGSWIALLDSDDQWLPEKIEKQWKIIEQFNEVNFLGCGRNNENLHFGKKVIDGLYRLDLYHILVKCYPHTSTALIHKSVFHNVGDFDENRYYAEDGELWNRIVTKYPLYYLSESLEIAGNYKAQFGESGLSKNLLEMHKGNLLNIKILRNKKEISTVFYVFLWLYYWAKYYRRQLLTNLRKKMRK